MAEQSKQLAAVTARASDAEAALAKRTKEAANVKGELDALHMALSEAHQRAQGLEASHMRKAHIAKEVRPLVKINPSCRPRQICTHRGRGVIPAANAVNWVQLSLLTWCRCCPDSAAACGTQEVAKLRQEGKLDGGGPAQGMIGALEGRVAELVSVVDGKNKQLKVQAISLQGIVVLLCVCSPGI